MFSTLLIVSTCLADEIVLKNNNSYSGEMVKFIEDDRILFKALPSTNLIIDITEIQNLTLYNDTVTIENGKLLVDDYRKTDDLYYDYPAELDNKLLGAFFGFRVANPYPEINYDEEPEWWIPFLELEEIAAGSWLLQAISILPEFRGRGHANALLARAEEEAKASGAKTITLQVEEINQIALETYTSNGYAELDRRELIPFPFSQDLGDIILMGKNLGA